MLKTYEVEERVTPTGKKLKQCVFQEEGKQHPHKRVTVWENHPEYNNITQVIHLVVHM